MFVTPLLSLVLETVVQTKFMFLGEFWSDLTKMSKAEKSAAEAEVSQLQGSTLVTNF